MHPLVRRCALLAAASLLATLSASAQQVWPVANQQQLLAAIAAAAPGDIVQLASAGAFERFNLNKGLTLRGPASIGSLTAALAQVTVPAGQVAQFVDLTFRVDTINPFQGPGTGAVQVQGTARFDGCTIQGSYTVGAALRLVRANALIERCTLQGIGSSAGILATDSVVSVHGSTVTGSRAYYSSASFPAGVAAPGIAISGTGSLHLSTSPVTGGGGLADPHYAPRPAGAGIETSVPTWLADATVTGGGILAGFQYPGATGLQVVGGATFHARCTIVGGASVGVPPAPPITGNATVDPTLLGVGIGPLSRGQAASLRVIADQPGTALAILATFGPSSPLLVPGVTQPVWLGSVTQWIGAGFTGGNSELALSIPVPADPLLQNLTCGFLGARLAGASVQLAPAAGGLIR